ncbi:hypothetical protein AB0L74_10190 [Streptomyces sp. NPDC052020]|uniref:hypothetical protein n=1 Tax=Streptomyces sp. NPDC052020 TaxID=3155677 RepID=UPI00343EB791
MSRKYPKKVRKEFKRKLARIMPREDGLRPFTVVQDWDSDMFAESCDDIQGSDDPQIFHVWAASGADASDEADRIAVERFGEEAAYYLSHVAILQGHAPFATD